MRNRSFMVLVALLAAAAPETVSQVYQEPGDYGYSYRTEDIPGVYETMEDSRIYYPDSGGVIPQSAVPCPVVVLGHGFMMGIDRYESYAEHLATWGYLVVLPTYSNPLIEPEHFTRARCIVDAALFTAGLDTQPGDLFFGKVDETNWGFTGHSMGGGCAFLAADTFDLADTLRVVVSFNSPQTTPPVSPAGLDLPKLVLAGGVDTTAPWQEVREAMWAEAPAPGAFAVIHGANHGYSMDYSYWWEDGGTATISREEQQATIRLYMTAYFERYLHGDASSLNFMVCYGDSILSDPALDSVEVRLETGISPGPGGSGASAGVIRVFPNPSAGPANLELVLASPTAVTVSIFDMLGRMVCVPADGNLSDGVHLFSWNGTDRDSDPLPPGIYMCVMETQEGAVAAKLVRR
ncbi:MAG: hypothetical protein AVO35_12075 [Candidatus Aegiribacteria sp. MLS_C]|nr:MAG: hypothetical protein AVO35_12075 [Candidatus Aegiribacteria sp. MLS_C]